MAGLPVRAAFALLGAIVVVVLAAGCGSSGKDAAKKNPGARPFTTSLPKTTSAAVTQHVGLSLAKLRNFAHGVKHTVYWVGPMKNVTYEVTYTKGGNFSVRYLTPGSKLGAKNYIVSVSTYPTFGGYDLLKQLTVENGMHAVKVSKPKKTVAVTSEAYPQSIRVAFPKKDYEIEVIAPSVARVKHLVTTGSVQPIS